MTENKKVWHYTRIGFYVMLIFWSIFVFIIDSESYSNFEAMLVFLWAIIIIFTFVNSIRHLLLYKKKTLAIISLCLSSYLLLVFIVTVIIKVIFIG